MLIDKVQAQGRVRYTFHIHIRSNSFMFPYYSEPFTRHSELTILRICKKNNIIQSNKTTSQPGRFTLW